MRPRPERLYAPERAAKEAKWKLYLAASSADIDRAKRWHQKLVAAGVEVVSTWISVVAQVDDANPRDASRRQRLDWSADDLAQVASASVLWFLVPPLDKPTRGAWIEFGYAVAATHVEPDPRMRTRLVCSGDTKQSIFCALGEEFEADDDAFARILDLYGQSIGDAFMARTAGMVRRERP